MQHSNVLELIPDSSRLAADRAAEMAASNWEIFEEFLTLTLNDDKIWGQRASRVINFACNLNPEFFHTTRSILINKIPELKNISIQRNLMKTLLDGNLTEEEEELGTLASYCFQILEKGPHIPAIQAYCMTMLARISEKYPELEDELCIILSSRLDDESAGIRCRAEQILRKMKKRRRL